jgi:hypothetical protein
LSLQKNLIQITFAIKLPFLSELGYLSEKISKPFSLSPNLSNIANLEVFQQSTNNVELFH